MAHAYETPGTRNPKPTSNPNLKFLTQTLTLTLALTLTLTLTLALYPGDARVRDAEHAEEKGDARQAHVLGDLQRRELGALAWRLAWLG